MPSRSRSVAPWIFAVSISLCGASMGSLSACSSSSDSTPVPSADAAAADGEAVTSPDSAGTTSGDAGDAAVVLTDDQQIQAITGAMHDALMSDLDALIAAATDLQNAAPTPTGRGWDATQDAAALQSMKDAWIRARTAYEHIEGALAPIFPDLDHTIDARYDDFMTDLLSAGGDADAFDDAGVTGLHAVERIVWANEIPARVVTFEKALPGYRPAAYPATAAQAVEFKTKLVAKVISDAQELHDQWQPSNINIAVAFQGLISLMNEQREKVTKASSNEEESRYSQRTMADIRDNLSGTKVIYGLFSPWLVSKTNASDPTKDGPTIDAKVRAGMVDLNAAYDAIQGDAIPVPPDTWTADNTTPADAASPFGVLYTKVKTAVDPANDGGIVFEMNEGATLLGFPQFTQ